MKQIGFSAASGADGQILRLRIGVGKESVNVHRISRNELMELLEAQDYCCALSGLTLTPQTAAADHIVSLADGGDDSMANCQILDAQVNKAKGTMGNAEFMAMCTRIHLHSARDRCDSHKDLRLKNHAS